MLILYRKIVTLRSICYNQSLLEQEGLTTFTIENKPDSKFVLFELVSQRGKLFCVPTLWPSEKRELSSKPDAYIFLRVPIVEAPSFDVLVSTKKAMKAVPAQEVIEKGLEGCLVHSYSKGGGGSVNEQFINAGTSVECSGIIFHGT